MTRDGRGKTEHGGCWCILRLIHAPRLYETGARMNDRYRQFMRKVRLYLLTEVRKKSWGSRFLSARMFEADYWMWTRRSVALGAGWGAVAAIAPLPMQSLWAVAACLWRKGNIPVGVLMAWLSPPGFTFFAVPAQWWLGWSLFTRLGLPSSGANFKMLESAVRQCSWEPFQGLSVGMVSLEFLVGWIVSSVVVGFACYGLALLMWKVGELLRRFRQRENE